MKSKDSRGGSQCPSLPSFIIPVSAVSGDGLEELRDAVSATLAHLFQSESGPSSPVKENKSKEAERSLSTSTATDDDDDEIDLAAADLTEEERRLLMLPEDELEKALSDLDDDAMDSFTKGGSSQEDQGEDYYGGSFSLLANIDHQENGDEEEEEEEDWEVTLLPEGSPVLSFKERRQKAISSQSYHKNDYVDVVEELDDEGEEGEGEEGASGVEDGDDLVASVEDLTEAEAYLLSLSSEELMALIQDGEEGPAMGPDDPLPVN